MIFIKRCCIHKRSGVLISCSDQAGAVSKPVKLVLLFNHDNSCWATPGDLWAKCRLSLREISVVETPLTNAQLLNIATVLPEECSAQSVIIACSCNRGGSHLLIFQFLLEGHGGSQLCRIQLLLKQIAWQLGVLPKVHCKGE